MSQLGYSATDLSKRLGVSQPSVSISVKHGEKIAKSRAVDAWERIESYIFMGVPNIALLSEQSAPKVGIQYDVFATLKNDNKNSTV